MQNDCDTRYNSAIRKEANKTTMEEVSAMSIFPTTTRGRLLALGGIAATTVLGGMFSFSQLSGKATKEENEWVYPSDDLIDENYDNGISSTYENELAERALTSGKLCRHIMQIERRPNTASGFYGRLGCR